MAGLELHLPIGTPGKGSEATQYQWSSSCWASCWTFGGEYIEGYSLNKATWRWREPTCLFFYINSDLDLSPWPLTLTLFTFDLLMVHVVTLGQTVPQMWIFFQYLSQTDRRTDGRTDGQKTTPKSPLCMSTGGLKNRVSGHQQVICFCSNVIYKSRTKGANVLQLDDQCHYSLVMSVCCTRAPTVACEKLDPLFFFNNLLTIRCRTPKPSKLFGTGHTGDFTVWYEAWSSGIHICKII